VGAGDAREHGDRDRGRAQPGLEGGLGEGPGPGLRPDGCDGEALLGRALAPSGELGAPDPRRLRVHGRVPDLPPVSRPEDPRDRRGDERGAADGHRPPPRVVGCGTVLLFRQFVNPDLGCASYLIGDADAGVAVVVDPAFEIEQYLDEDVRIERVLETHTHADHVSGHGRFALEHGLPVAIHALAEPEYPFEALADGDVIRVGAVEIRVLHTPGHRPEHCAFLVEDEIVLTGDSLFVGDTARPDLAVAAREGAEDLFHSL